jgi:hypothetical protein
MKNKPARQTHPAHFYFKDAGWESLEAEARHIAYIKNAYATLSPTPELLLRGAQAGLLVSVVLLLLEALLLFVFIVPKPPAGGFGELYGPTPLDTTFLEPVWPILLSLPALPLFTIIGALAALARRTDRHWRRALDNYFIPVAPFLDFFTFWLSILFLLVAALWAADYFTEFDPIFMVIFTISLSGLVAYLSHLLWAKLYLSLLQKHSSVSLDQIRAIIKQQLVSAEQD